MEQIKTIFLHSPLFRDIKGPIRGGLRNAESVVHLCKEMQILASEEIQTAPEASREQLELFHDAPYVESLLARLPESNETSLLLSRTVAGGSLLGADMLAQGKADMVFFPAGGDTHSRPGAPSGQDWFNDSALAVSFLSSLGVRVAFVNISARHAEAIQTAFYEQADVLTVSVHEGRRDMIPSSGFVGEDGLGEGKGSALNIPLSEGVFDDAALEIIHDILLPFLRRKQPDILVAVISPDILASDGSTSSLLTNNVLVETVRSLASLHRPLLVLGGDAQRDAAAARTWALLWAAMTKRVFLAQARAGDKLFERQVFVPPQRRLSVGKEMKSVLDILRKRLYGTRLPTRKDLKAIEELDQE